MKEKQIAEMAKDLQETHDYEGCEAWHCGGCQYEKYGKGYFCSSIKQAEKMTAKGYRKQSEGEWIWINQATSYLEPPYGDTCKCSFCEFEIDVSESNYKYCPNCGARMRGAMKMLDE